MAENDLELRRKLAKQGRLWLLSLICATAGALVVWARTRESWCS
ncbi:MAG TPA: hypothetical protein VK499_03955 [Propionibacteriaceae bacterium]|nr:hypothetical protein [Propionibacteriaceae bacterium]